MLFSAVISDFKVIYNVLKSISFKEFSVVHPMKEGLKITVEEMKCVETSVYIPCNMFSTYHVQDDEEIKFKISLKILTECLNIFGDDGNPSLKITYADIASPLRLVLNHSEENITVDCEIKTMSVDDFAELSLAEESTLNKIVMNAAPLGEVLNDIDSMADELHLLLSPDPPYFRITTKSILGECQVDISKQSDAILIFQSNSMSLSRYAFSNIKQVLRVLSLANKISLSMGDTGLLGLQLVIYIDDQKQRQIYVEFYVTPLFASDD